MANGESFNLDGNGRELQVCVNFLYVAFSFLAGKHRQLSSRRIPYKGFMREFQGITPIRSKSPTDEARCRNIEGKCNEWRCIMYWAYLALRK